MNGRTHTPKRWVSSIHGGWATAAAVAAVEAHLMAAAATLVVVEAAAAAGERHLPAVVVAAQLHQGSRVSQGPGIYPGLRPQRPSDALWQAP